MTDYRDLLKDKGLSAEADAGRRAKVAVLDCGRPPFGFPWQTRPPVFSGPNRGSDNSHATFICSLLFGDGDIKGLCPKAEALFYDVYDGSSAQPETIASAIRYAAHIWGADVINLSLGFSRIGGDCPSVVRAACQDAVKRGVTLIAAAGNDGGQVLWPAALPEVICVGSTNAVEKAEFSNTGEIDFVAPGVDLEGYTPDGHVTTKNGTSFSAALLAGLTALLVSRARTQGRGVSPDEIRNDLVEHCTDLGIPGRDDDTGYGTPFLVPVQKPSVFGRIKMFLKKLFRRN